MEDPPHASEEASLSELTVELMEQAAALAGERLSAPIREAGAYVARLVMVAGGAVASFLVAAAFLGVGIALLIGQAPEAARWWICLVVAGLFVVTGAILAHCAAGRRKPRTPTDEAEDGQSQGTERAD